MLLATIPALAETDESESFKLTVKPVLCIVDRRTPSCDMQFMISWESSRSGYYCLYNDLSTPPVRCWTDARRGKAIEEHEVSSEFSYWMTGLDDGVRIAAVTIEVLSTDSGDRRRKRRSRHVWDIL